VGVFAAFALSRLPFLVYYYLPVWAEDTWGYFAPVAQLLDGEVPLFDIRTPGYPLFLWAIYLIGGDVDWVPVAQMAATLAGALFLVHAVARAYGRMALLAAVAMAGFVSSSTSVWYDGYLGPESLYSSSLMLIAALLIRIVRERKPRDYLALSCAIALAIMIRPAGLYLIVSSLLVLIYLAARQVQLRRVILAFLPLPMSLLALCSYNYLTCDKFSLNPFGVMNLTAATSTYWAEDPSLPAEYNEAIRAQNALIREDDRSVLQNEWDLNRLYGIYDRYYNESIYRGPLSRLPVDYDVRGKIALIAIKSDPGQYLKFIATQLHAYNIKNISYRAGYYTLLHYSYGSIMVARKFADAEMFRRFFASNNDGRSNLPYYKVEMVANGRAEVRTIDTLVKRIHLAFLGLQEIIFRQKIWGFAFLPVVLLSAVQWLRTRFVDERYSLIFSIASLHFGAGLLVAMVEESLWRYSYPTEFACYLSMALVPLLFVRNKDMAS